MKWEEIKFATSRRDTHPQKDGINPRAATVQRALFFRLWRKVETLGPARLGWAMPAGLCSCACICASEPPCDPCSPPPAAVVCVSSACGAAPAVARRRAEGCRARSRTRTRSWAWPATPPPQISSVPSRRRSPLPCPCGLPFNP